MASKKRSKKSARKPAARRARAPKPAPEAAKQDLPKAPTPKVIEEGARVTCQGHGGTFQGLNDDGKAKVALDNGRTVEVDAGEVKAA